MEQSDTVAMNQRTSMLVGMAFFCVLLWFVYPLLAVWTADRVPFAHLVLLPGGSPTLAKVTLIWALVEFLLQRLEPPLRRWKPFATAIGVALAIGWAYVFGYWMLMAWNGGV